MSDDNFTVEVNTVEFETSMQILRKGVRDGFVDPTYGTLPVQGRLLAERCQDFTPPQNRAQGQAAVARDLTRIFRPLSDITFTRKSIKKIIRSDDRPAWNTAAARFSGSHGLKNTKAIGFDPSWHTANRISRGRARGLSGKMGRDAKDNLGVVTLGPEGRKARAYMKEIKGHVGWARAGWNAGIVGLGGTVRASWVSRHGNSGGFLNNGTASPDPFIHIGNTTSWAKYGSQGEGNRILANAISARARDMESYAIRMMNLAANKAQHAA